MEWNGMEWSGVIHRFLESPCPTLRHSGAAAEPMWQVTQVEQTRQGSHQKKQKLARARSASLGRSKNAARTRSALPGRSKLLGLAARKHRTCRRFRGRARSARLGRSTLALEPARLRCGDRHGRSSRLSSARPGFENTAPADVCDIAPARLRWGARNGRSSQLGSAGALEMAPRTRSALLGRSK